MIAAWRGHSSIVAELVRAGVQVDAQDQVTAACVCVYTCVCTSTEWWQPVHVHNHVVYIICIVQMGLTSLMLAIYGGYIKIVESLLNANADPNITDNVSNEWEMVATLLIDFCFSIDHYGIPYKTKISNVNSNTSKGQRWKISNLQVKGHKYQEEQ